MEHQSQMIVEQFRSMIRTDLAGRDLWQKIYEQISIPRSAISLDDITAEIQEETGENFSARINALAEETAEICRKKQILFLKILQKLRAVNGI